MTLDLFGDVSTFDDGDREEYDFYETPRFMAWSLLHFYPALIGASILEPASGRDAIAAVLRQVGCQVFTNDIDPRHRLAMTHEDATTDAYWRTASKVDYVVSNLPFIPAFDIVTRAFEHARLGVGFLLRKTWSEPTDIRGEWLSVHPPNREVRQPRYPFRGKGSDSCACDWMIWEKCPQPTTRPIEIDHLAESRGRGR